MASKRDRKVAFADDVETENKKARSEEEPPNRSYNRSESNFSVCSINSGGARPFIKWACTCCIAQMF